MKLEYVLMYMLLACPVLAQAEIYKAIDADGHVTYSSAPIKGGKKLNLEPLPTMVPPAKAKSPEEFPRVNRETQKNRDDMRRKILQDELDAEEKLLAEARQNLKEASPEVFTGQDGKTYRNVERYEAKIKLLDEEVELHEQNIVALKTELSKLKQQ
ncbi:MAG: DUF4124 domain-containing protein [Nitrosomonadales bacterium]|nr:DUF4124 domain-containing protein [Nitrosomonadales bacterium]